ncbi:MAG TPA: hypothetical protein EYP56_06125 [Planctomycetaceae bacterium]|nr:hypothetical protein [Planctomycetaceae bacterium]
MQVAVAGRWDRRAQRLSVTSAKLAAGAFLGQAEQVVFGWPEPGRLELGGALACQGRLEQLQRWFAFDSAPWQIDGRFVARADVRPRADVTAGTLDVRVDELTVRHESGRRIEEKLVRLTAQGQYERRTRTVKLAPVALVSAAASARGAAGLALGHRPPRLQMEGQLDYDLERLSQWFPFQTDSNVFVAGRGSNPFWYRGPLSWREGEGGGGIDWQSCDAYGFRFGPGRLDLALARGMLQVRPVNVAVNEGRLHLAPQLRFAGERTELVFPAGPLAERIRINPAMCAHFLQYIAPILAGVASAEGTFSIELDGCRVPLDDPASGDLAGRMIIHDVQIGPGPLIRQLAVALRRDKPAQLRRESVVEFRMVQGRVYHRGLELQFPDLTIRTYGSVGLDQSLAVLAEIPIPPDWKTGSRLDAALRNQTIRIPIAGTLSRPTLDTAALERYQAELLGRAAQNLLEDELRRRLDELLRRRQ